MLKKKINDILLVMQNGTYDVGEAANLLYELHETLPHDSQIDVVLDKLLIMRGEHKSRVRNPIYGEERRLAVDLVKHVLLWEKEPILTRYASKSINPNYYGKLEVSKGPYDFSKTQTLPSGAIFVPYIMGEHTEESLKEYKKVSEKYHNEHKYCPKCGATGGTVTLMGYIRIQGEESKYKDKNTYVCSICGDVHTVHDRTKANNHEKYSRKDMIEFAKFAKSFQSSRNVDDAYIEYLNGKKIKNKKI